MSSLRVMVKRGRGKKRQEETEKHQHIIMTENNLFKGYATKRVLIKGVISLIKGDR